MIHDKAYVARSVSLGFMSLMLVAGLIVLFAAPGPTNALLFAAGADGGVRHGFAFAGAVATGYVAAVLMLGILAAPLLIAAPPLVEALRLAASVYLAAIAWRMWGRTVAETSSGKTTIISPTGIAVATLLNPKGLIITLTLLPPETFGSMSKAFVALALIAVLSAAAGALWLLLGAHAGRTLRRAGGRRLANRGSAAILGAFAAALAASALAG